MFVKQKSISIAIAMCFLFGMISSSGAEIEIIDMTTPSETYNDGWFYHHVYVETDIAYDTIYWYIGDADGDDDDLQYVGETLGVDGATRAWFYPDVSDCPGHIKGQKYRVAAKAWYYNPETETSTSDWETRDFTVFQSISTTEVETPPKRLKSVYGYSKLARQYYTGSSIAIDCSVYASTSNSKGIYWAWSRFKHSLTDRRTIERDHPGPNGEDAQRIGGDFGSYSHSDTLTHSNINLQNGEYTSGAYVRLIVSGPGEDHYLIKNSATFTKRDKPYDAP